MINSIRGPILFIYLFIYSSLLSYATLGYERPTPHLLTDINIHSDTQAEPRKLSSLTLYIDLWPEGKPAPGQNPPVISPPVVIFRRICVRAEIRTQNPVLSNTRLAKMVPLSHLRRQVLFSNALEITRDNGLIVSEDIVRRALREKGYMCTLLVRSHF
jgi:hypothetical protein